MRILTDVVVIGVAARVALAITRYAGYCLRQRGRRRAIRVDSELRDEDFTA